MQQEDVALDREGGARGEGARLQLREEKRLLEQEVAHLRCELRRYQVEQEHASTQAAAALSEAKERVAVEEKKIEKCFKGGGVQQVLQYLYRFNPPRIKGSKLFEVVMKKATPISRILCAIQHYHPDQQGGNELVNGMFWTRFCVIVTALLNSYREQLTGGPRVQ